MLTARKSNPVGRLYKRSGHPLTFKTTPTPVLGRSAGQQAWQNRCRLSGGSPSAGGTGGTERMAGGEDVEG